MKYPLVAVLALSLVLVSGVATAATPEVYALDAGPGEQKTLGDTSTETMDLYIDAGPEIGLGTVCEDSDGDQLCAIDVTITLVDGLGLITGFTAPMTGPSVVSSFTVPATQLRLNVLQSLSTPAAGPQFLGELTLDLSIATQVDPTKAVASGQVVDAGGNLQTIPTVTIAVPEPGHAVLLLCGIIGLALLSRLRGVA